MYKKQSLLDTLSLPAVEYNRGELSYFLSLSSEIFNYTEDLSSLECRLSNLIWL